MTSVPETVEAGRVPCHVWSAAPVPGPDRYLPLLDAPERARFAAYAHEDDRARFVTGRLLAKAALARQLGTGPGAVRLHTRCAGCGGPHGKPRPVGAAAGWELSVSHSGDRVMVAITEGVPLGLDVERLPAPEAGRDAADDDPAEAELTLTPGERAALAALPPRDRPRAFLTYWTRKEAVLKATGDGLAVPMTDFSVSAPGGPARVLAWDGPDRPAVLPVLTDLTEEALGLGDSYLAALALLGSARPRVRAHGGEELLEDARAAVRAAAGAAA
ncbi:4'-phosphopantetheinyl transferase family protein [Streptomyces sp. URMC 123]|uniref:4'-phosphopantetheinyl transferase family protein n=1 Tax=Streptomyces sp. URMC 123 TaxID=3423403 RepID=UPI003F53832B